MAGGDQNVCQSYVNAKVRDKIVADRVEWRYIQGIGLRVVPRKIVNCVQAAEQDGKRNDKIGYLRHCPIPKKADVPKAKRQILRMISSQQHM